MIDTIEQTTCKSCGKPLEQAERRGPHWREYCNAVPGVTSAQLPDVVANPLGEPEVAIGPRRDAYRVTRRRERKLSDAPAGADATDLIHISLGEPEVALGPRRDGKRSAACRQDWKFADFAGERQCTGSSQGYHTDEQAQQPDEQGETM